MSAAKARLMEEIERNPKQEDENEFYEKTEEIRLALDSRMLGQVASHVSEFAENEYDTTLACVLRLLRDYHYAKAEIAGYWLEREGKK